MYRKSILDNGLRVVTCQMPHMQSVALGVWVNAGSRFETEKNNGIAHFLEHLLFKGSKNFSCRKLKQTIEGLGGYLNGFTSEELCCYLVKLPHRYLALALDVLSDMILNPLLNKEDIGKERNVIAEEIKMHRDLPQSYMHELLDGLLWPGHPLGMNILGAMESIKGLTRDDFILFKKKYYTMPNIVIAVCGNLEHDKVLHKAQRIFRIFRTNKINKFDRAKVCQNRPQLRLSIKDTEQTHLTLGFHGLDRNDPHRFTLRLLHIILGANMSSRLFHELREKKGLAYEIGTQVKFFADTGSFIVNAGIDNKNVTAALEVILKELDNLKKNLVSQRELKRAKEFYIGQLSISLEDTLEHMLWIGEPTIALDKIYTLDEVIDEVDKITSEYLRHLAQRIFRYKDRNLAVIGPLKDKEEELYECLGRN